jgi:hypothetical protein
MTEDEFEKAVNHITARCLQWRVIIEGGIVPSRDEASWDGGGAGGDGGARWEGSTVESAPLDAAEFTRRVDRRDIAKTRERIVLEAVIDVSSLRPRVAMLRDVTHVALARRLGADVKAALPDEPDATDTPATPEPPKTTSTADTAARESAGHDLDLGGLELDDLEPTETSTPPDISSPSESQPDKDTSPGSTTPAGSSADPRVGRWTTGGQGGKP